MRLWCDLCSPRFIGFIAIYNSSRLHAKCAQHGESTRILREPGPNNSHRYANDPPGRLKAQPFFRTPAIRTSGMNSALFSRRIEAYAAQSKENPVRDRNVTLSASLSRSRFLSLPLSLRLPSYAEIRPSTSPRALLQRTGLQRRLLLLSAGVVYLSSTRFKFNPL